MTDTPATTPACVHEYTLNVQLTHAWCQKCDSILPLVAGSIRDTIFAAGAAGERQRIRQAALDINGRQMTADDVLDWLFGLLDGGGQDTP